MKVYQTILLGLIGKKQSGKSTFAGILEREHCFQQVAFADPLREALLTLNPLIPLKKGFRAGDVSRSVPLSWVIEAIGWDRAKEEHPEVRRLLQAFGTDVGRNLFGKEVWVDRGIDRATDLLHFGDVVITDVRFKNEAEAIARHGGHLVRIVDPNRPDSGDQHRSEVELDGYPTDYVIHNHKDLGLEALEFEARKLMIDINERNAA